MNIKLIILGLIATICCVSCVVMSDSEDSNAAVVASGTCGTDLNWEFDDSTGVLTISGNGTTTAQPTPSDWGGYRTNITEIVFNTPNLTTIGSFTFQVCTNLTTITLPDTVTALQHSAFSDCTALAITELPDSITQLGPATFINCQNLALTSLPENLTEIPVYAFYSCYRMPLASLPDGITTIDAGAFTRCYQLNFTSLPDGLTTIGSTAFSQSNIQLTTLPDSLTNIKSEAFRQCYSLKSLILSENFNPTIASDAFKDCTNLKEIFNLSELDLTAGSESYGMIAYYADTVSDNFGDTAIVQQKEYRDHYVVVHDDAASKILVIVPVFMVLAILLAVSGVAYLRRD